MGLCEMVDRASNYPRAVCISAAFSNTKPMLIGWAVWGIGAVGVRGLSRSRLAPVEPLGFTRAICTIRDVGFHIRRQSRGRHFHGLRAKSRVEDANGHPGERAQPRADARRCASIVGVFDRIGPRQGRAHHRECRLHTDVLPTTWCGCRSSHAHSPRQNGLCCATSVPVSSPLMVRQG